MTTASKDQSFVPRLLTFYQDVVLDDDDFSSGYRTIGWGVRWPDGTVVTLTGASGSERPTVTTWPSLEQAVETLDVLVADVAPQRSLPDSTGGSNGAGPAAEQARP